MDLALNEPFKILCYCVAARLNSSLQSRTTHIHVSHTDMLQNIIIGANFDLQAHFQVIMSQTQKIICSICECTYIIILQVPQS